MVYRLFIYWLFVSHFTKNCLLIGSNYFCRQSWPSCNKKGTWQLPNPNNLTNKFRRYVFTTGRFKTMLLFVWFLQLIRLLQLLLLTRMTFHQSQKVCWLGYLFLTWIINYNIIEFINMIIHTCFTISLPGCTSPLPSKTPSSSRPTTPSTPTTQSWRPWRWKWKLRRKKMAALCPSSDLQQ